MAALMVIGAAAVVVIELPLISAWAPALRSLIATEKPKVAAMEVESVESPDSMGLAAMPMLPAAAAASAPSTAVAFRLLIAVPRMLLIVALVEGDELEEALRLRAIEPGIDRF